MITRTRTLPRDNIAGFRKIWAKGGGNVNYQSTEPSITAPHHPSFLHTSYMEDENHSGGAWKYGNCVHDSFRAESGYYTDYGGLNSYIAYTDRNPLTYGVTTSLWDVVYPIVRRRQRRGVSWLQDFMSSAKLPDALVLDRDPFDTGFNIWYLVVDLLDLRRLLPQVSSIVSNAKYFSRSGGLTVGALREGSNAYLLSTFGISPTLRDIREFILLLQKWRDVYDHMDELIKVIHRVKQPRVDFLGSTGSIIRSGEFDYRDVHRVKLAHLDAPLLVYEKLVVRELVWSGTATYKFSCPEAKGWLDRLKQFVDAFGVADVGSAVWDSIPFSFLVDWLVGVGNWVHANRPQLFPASVVLQDYCESISYKADITYDSSWTAFTDSDGPLVYSDRQERVCRAEHKLYLRRRGKPRILRVSAPKISKSFVTIDRALIGSALVGQRLVRSPVIYSS